MLSEFLDFFLLLYGHFSHVKIVILRLLLSNNVSCCESWCVCTYVLQVLASFFDDYLWFACLLIS